MHRRLRRHRRQQRRWCQTVHGRRQRTRTKPLSRLRLRGFGTCLLREPGERIQTVRELFEIALLDRSMTAREVLSDIRETQMGSLCLQLPGLLLQSDHSRVGRRSLAGERMPPPL